jgi:hypothetical protein
VVLVDDLCVLLSVEIVVEE